MKILFKCSNCNGTNIQELAWVDTNTQKYIDFYESVVWCSDCETEVSVIEEELK